MFQDIPVRNLSASVISLIFTAGSFAQTAANTASIAGKTIEENGAPVRALVTATARGALVRVSSGLDGAFTFTGLAAGSYRICAQPLSGAPGPRQDPLVDSCTQQNLSDPKYSLAANQTRIGAIVTLQRGVLLNVRVNDPSKLLPAIAGSFPASQHLTISIAGPSGFHRIIPITAQDTMGRTHGIVIPYDTRHKLFVRGGFALKDSNGRDYDGVTPVDIQAARGVPLPAIEVNIGRTVKP